MKKEIRYKRPNSIVVLAMIASLISVAGLAQAERLPTTSPGPAAAELTGSPARLGESLFSVRFTAIDGRNIRPREEMWLEPGSYELSVVVDADFGPTGLLRGPRSFRDRSAQTIQVEVEPGYRYHIRARYNSQARERDLAYNIIIWKVEEI